MYYFSKEYLKLLPEGLQEAAYLTVGENSDLQCDWLSMYIDNVNRLLPADVEIDFEILLRGRVMQFGFGEHLDDKSSWYDTLPCAFDRMILYEGFYDYRIFAPVKWFY